MYTIFATELLDGRDAAMMHHHLGNRGENLDVAYVEDAFEAAGLAIEQKAGCRDYVAGVPRGAEPACVEVAPAALSTTPPAR